jgi:nicotinamidase-related amidase
MLSEKNTVLVVIDVQSRLLQTMHEREDLVANLQKLIRGVQAMGIPVLWLEQNPERMGETAPEIRVLLSGAQTVLNKMTFSCCGEPRFMHNVEALGRQQILLAGIEAHVCVYQTAADLLSRSFEVHVVADAVSSRRAFDKTVGIDRMRSIGARIACLEMVLFELLRTAGHPAFKSVLKIVR